MTAVPVAERLTAEEFLALPEPWRGQPRLWLVEGEVVLNQPAALHGHVNGNVLFALESWTRSELGGRGAVVMPRDVVLDEHNVYAPDVLWYSRHRIPDPRARPGYAMPDLAVEIRSPSTWRYDVGAKKAAYERHGLPELWLVDTDAAAVLVYRRSRPDAPTFDVALELSGDDQELTSPLLPGFALALAEVFRLP